MRSYLTALGLLFIALCHPSFAQKSAAAESVVVVAEGAPLAVECPLAVEARAEWRRDGAAPPSDLRQEEAARGAGAALAARLSAAAARRDHAGVYTCSRGPRAHRTRVLVLPAAAAASATPAGVAGTEPAGAGADEEPLPIFKFDVNRPFALNCSLPDIADGADAGPYAWYKNGTALEQVADLRGRYKLEAGGAVLQLTARAHEDDYGNYTCGVGGVTVRGWQVHARPVARLPPNSNVVEGQKLRLTCKVIGKPYPAVTWTYALAEGENATDLEAALGDRATLAASAAGVPRGELTLEAATRADAGVYACQAAADTPPAATTLRVKDMYAALWPFLGICAEVFVLCAIILVYERRRTKPELDDSDTDNHDQ